MRRGWTAPRGRPRANGWVTTGLAAGLAIGAAPAFSQEAPGSDNPPMVRLVREAESSLRHGDVATALARYEAALKAGAGSADLLNRMAELYLRQGNPDRALELLHGSLRERPGQLVVYSGLNESFQALGRLDSALYYVRTARQLAPESSSVRTELAYLHLQDGTLAAARAQLDSALLLDADNVQAYRLLALYHSRTDQPDSAITCYHSVLERNPDDVEAHNNIAFLLAARKDYAESLEWYRKTKALTTDPQLLHAINLNMEAVRAIMDGKMRARFILVGTEAQARDLRHRVTEEKEDFAELARRFSQAPNARDGGDLGFFGPGDMLPTVEESVLQLAVGEVSPVIHIEQGWMLIQRLN